MTTVTSLVLLTAATLGQADEVSPHYKHLKFMEPEIGVWIVTEWEYHPGNGPSQTYRLENESDPEYTYEVRWRGRKAWIEQVDASGVLDIIGWDVANRVVTSWRFQPNGARKVNVLIHENEEEILWDDHFFGAEASKMHFGGSVKTRKLSPDERERTVHDREGKLVVRMRARRKK